MSSSSSSAASSSAGGIGFLGALTIAFVVLKLTGYIDWSWWWIWSPLWGPVAVVFAVVICWFVVNLQRDYRRTKAIEEDRRLRREQLEREVHNKEDRFAGS